MISYILAVLVAILIVGADQYTKMIVNSTMINGKSITFIKGIIDFTYVENSGSAWGMLSGHTWILIAATFVIMLVLIALLLKYGVKNKLLFWATVLVLAGGIGNMIDRVFRGGKVIDFLQFAFWKDFPVFNIADCAVVIGAGMMVLYFVIDIIKENKAKRENGESVSQNGEN